jgi:methionyl-tRNA formyltransferase
MPLRLVLMGTGPFAVPTFRALLDGPHEVLALVTQPDREGPGRRRESSPARLLAESRGLPVLQPPKANAPESVAHLRTLAPDLFVVADFGQILSAELLSVPRLGAVNVHASILPRHRGAAPVQHAVWAGDDETGVTIFRLEPKLDAGPVLAVVRTPIGDRETAGGLEARLAELAVPAVREVVDGLEAGTLVPIPQDHAAATKAPKLTKSDGVVDWTASPRAIDRHVRAMQPWPRPATLLHAKNGNEPLRRLLILEVQPCEVPRGAAGAVPGTIVAFESDRFVVRTGPEEGAGADTGAVAVLRVQPEAKRAMSTAEYLRGRVVQVGDRCGPEATGTTAEERSTGAG